jgi:hypothetical protein
VERAKGHRSQYEQIKCAGKQLGLGCQVRALLR